LLGASLDFIASSKNEKELAAKKLGKESAVGIINKVLKRFTDIDTIVLLWREGTSSDIELYRSTFKCISTLVNIMPEAFQPTTLIPALSLQLEATGTVLQDKQSNLTENTENKQEGAGSTDSGLTQGTTRFRLGLDDKASRRTIIFGARSALLRSLPPLLVRQEELENLDYEAITPIAHEVVQFSSYDITEQVDKLQQLRSMAHSTKNIDLRELFTVQLNIKISIDVLREIIDANPNFKRNFVREILTDAREHSFLTSLSSSVELLLDLAHGENDYPAVIRLELSKYFGEV
jgi:hypothetical protein